MTDKPTIGSITFGAPYNPDNPPPGVTSIGSEGVLKYIGPSAPPKTMRDEFATAALPHALAHARGVYAAKHPGEDDFGGDYVPLAAATAYEIADAMLKARADATPTQDAA